MEYLVPILAVVVIGVLTLLVTRWLSGRPSSASADEAGSPEETSREATPERARAAARRLDEPTHRAVYGHIAQGRPFEAVRDYRRHTGRPVREALLDVQSLTLHPQVYSLPVPEAEAPAPSVPTSEPGPRPETDRADLDAPRDGEDCPAGTIRGHGAHAADPADSVGEVESGSSDGMPVAGEATEPAERDVAAGALDDVAPGTAVPSMPSAREELTSLTIPDDWTAEPTPEDPPFEVEVMRGDESVRLASADLPPWLRDQLSAMVRDGNLESAAVQLSSHSSLSVPEAFELLRRMKERREGGT